jgi:aspartate-semialdehyde dehydrogenase
VTDTIRTISADALAVLEAFTPPEIVRHLPSSPERALIVHRVGDRPQPRCDHNAGRGISASGGRVRACPVLDVRVVALSHNPIRDAAGGAILNAELLVASDIVS